MPAAAFSRSLALSGRPVHSRICQQQSRLFRALAPQLRRFNRPVLAAAHDSQQLSESTSLAKAVSVDAVGMAICLVVAFHEGSVRSWEPSGGLVHVFVVFGPSNTQPGLCGR